METKNLNFHYRGTRNYVHGSDIYNQVSTLIKSVILGSSWGRFKIVFHEISRNQCHFVYEIGTDSLIKPENGKVEFSFVSDSGKIGGWMVEGEKPVIQKDAYDEEIIFNKCSVVDKTISIKGKTPYTPIEVLIAMNKQLHLSLFADVKEKWLFARLELVRLLEKPDDECFKIELINNLQYKLTKSRIWVNDNIIGSIYYSLVKS